MNKDPAGGRRRKGPPTHEAEDGALYYSASGTVYEVDDGTLRRLDLELSAAKERGATPLPRA